MRWLWGLVGLIACGGSGPMATDGSIDSGFDAADAGFDAPPDTFVPDPRPCPGDHRITTRDELDALAGCTNIGGNLEIIGVWGEDVWPLERVTEIGGHFHLERCRFENLDHLSALGRIGGELRIVDNDDLESLDGLDGLGPVPGDVILDDNDGLTTLRGLGVTAIGGAFEVRNHRFLENLAGIGGVSTLGSLVVEENAGLTSLDGLEQLTTIEGAASISGNLLLERLDGLDRLESIGGDFIVVRNWELVDISGLGALESVGGRFTLDRNVALESLDGLDALVTVPGALALLGNAALADIGGLSALETVGGLTVRGSPLLTSLDGFPAFGTLDHLRLEGLALLADLSALESVTNVRGDLAIVDCPAITSLATFAALDDLAGELTIQGTGVTSLAGLDALQGTVRGVHIVDNVDLTTLSGLGPITTVGDVTIESNDLLYRPERLPRRHGRVDSAGRLQRLDDGDDGPGEREPRAGRGDSRQHASREPRRALRTDDRRERHDGRREPPAADPQRSVEPRPHWATPHRAQQPPPAHVRGG